MNITHLHFIMKTYCLYKSISENSFSFFEENDQINIKLLPPDSKRIWSITTTSWEIACLKEHEFLGWEPYKPCIISTEDLSRFLPKDKSDIDNFHLLRNLGYPMIEPVLEKLFEWIRDMNWPVAQEIAPFLVSIGKPIIPYVKNILLTNDNIWKYWVLTSILEKLPSSTLQLIKTDLEQLKQNFPETDISEEIPLIANKLLLKLK